MTSYTPEPEDYNPDEQLRDTLQSSITQSLSSNRPLLTHLNLDTTWLLSLPYPDKAESASNPHNRTFFHILIDPWLAGSQSDVARFFSQQWHSTESSASSIAAVESVIENIENAARGQFENKQPISPPPSHDEDEDKWLGAVVVSHEFTDHMHKETLLEVPKLVPVYATAKAAGIIRSWDHFENVVDIERFEGDWRTTKHKLLPDWCSVSRVAYDGLDLLYFHSAIMIAWTPGVKGKAAAEAEAVIYTPHGIDPENLSKMVESKPKIQTLALLHGLQDVQISSGWTRTVKAQLNKGAHNGLKVQRMLKSRYWIGTHDENKKSGGIVSWFLDRKGISVREAVDLEKKGIEEEEGKEMELGDVRFVELGNGESLLLE